MSNSVVYSSSFSAVALVIGLITLIINLVERRMDNKQTMVFNGIMVVIVLSAFSNIIIVETVPYCTSDWDTQAHIARIIAYLGQTIYFLAHSALAPLFYLYVLFVTGGFFRQRRIRKSILMIPAIVMEFLVVLNCFVPVVWHYDENYTFVRDTGELAIYLGSAFYLVLAAVNLFLYWHAVTFRRRWSIAYAYLLTIAGILIQLFCQRLLLELAFEALSLAGIMMTVEKEDDRLDAATGIYNRNALRMDVENFFRMERSFHIICVRITNSDILKKITGSADRDFINQQVTSYLCNIHPRYELYHVSPAVFAIICHNYKMEDVQHLAEAIAHRFDNTWSCQGMEMNLNAAILYAEAPRELRSMEDIYLMIDGSLEDICDQGIHAGGILRILKRQMEVADAIRAGLLEHRFEVYYQPIYQVKNKAPVAAEATLRLQDPELGEILPEEIAAVAKRNDLLERIGTLLFDEVCMFLSTGIPTQMRLNQISIALFALQCLHPEFVPRMKESMKRYGIKASYINIELREFSLSEDYSELKTVLQELRSLGFSISLGRFGSGETNLQALYALDFDTVCMDLSLQEKRDLATINMERSIIKNTVQMIRGLEKQTLIKGAHTEGQVEYLEKQEVDFLQGDYYSKSVTQNELIGLLRVTEMAWREEQRARAQSEAKSNFLANMSHEIRTPINAILGMNEMILRESENEDILSYARDIERAGNTLLSLISDILDFSKIEAGSMEIVESEYGLSSVINDAVNMIQVRIQEKELKLVLDVDENLPEKLFGDEMRLRQIIVNILNNAVKYTAEGSITLHVHGTYTTEREDVILLIIDVEDTGMGIKKEDLGKLFGTFQRLDLERNNTVEGAGLGLAITASLLNMMGGEIGVESEYGKGSVFSVRLPQIVKEKTPIGDLKKRYNAHSKSRPVYQERFRAPEAAILVVDDTPINLTVIKSLLKQTELQVDTCLSGAECLEKIHEKHYDVIFLDYRMPEMDGLATLGKMKAPADHLNVDTPVICLTANVVSGAKENFIKEGFDDYLAKPVDSQKLESMLVQYLPVEKVQVVEEEEKQPEEIVEEPAAEVEKNGERPEGFLGEIYDLPEVDLAAGLERCGDEEGYLEILRIYYDTAEEKAKEIQRFMDEEDWENYTIRVHSLKSTSRVIGLLALGDAAAALEAAGETGDIPMIRKRTPVLLKNLKAFTDKLQELYAKEEEEDSSLPEADEQMLKDAYQALKEFAENMDFENASFVLEEMADYRLPQRDKELFDELGNAVNQLDWNRVTELLRRRKGGLK